MGIEEKENCEKEKEKCDYVDAMIDMLDLIEERNNCTIQTYFFMLNE